MADRKVKAPAVVWVVFSAIGPLARRTRLAAQSEANAYSTVVHRYRLDTPKPAAKDEAAVIRAAKRWNRTGDGFQLSEALYQLERAAKLKSGRPKPAPPKAKKRGGRG